MAPTQEWITISGFCKYAGVHKSRVYEWIRLEKNPLPAYRPGGGHWRINIHEAEEWMRSSGGEKQEVGK